MGKKIGLNAAERFIIYGSGMLPKEGNFITMRPLESLIKKASLSETEVKKYVTEDKDAAGVTKGYSFNNAELKQIEFTDGEISIVIAALKKLDTDKKIELKHLTLWEKFIGFDEEK